MPECTRGGALFYHLYGISPIVAVETCYYIVASLVLHPGTGTDKDFNMCLKGLFEFLKSFTEA